jgi:hypothetical protein
MLQWLLFGNCKHRWQHGVMCTVWLTLALLWYFHPYPKATVETRAFNLMFCSFAFGFQLRSL